MFHKTLPIIHFFVRFVNTRASFSLLMPFSSHHLIRMTRRISAGALHMIRSTVRQKTCPSLRCPDILPEHPQKAGMYQSSSDNITDFSSLKHDRRNRLFYFSFLLCLNAIAHDTAKPPQRPVQPIIIRIIALVLILRPPSAKSYQDLHNLPCR